MSRSKPRVAARLIGLARAAGQNPAADAELLTRYVRCRDEDAFAELVERHGPLVLAVCRRALGEAHAAEDAFQAAFLALARNAGRLRDPGAVSAWLYGAALRASMSARRSLPRTTPRPRPVARRAVPDPLELVSGREVLAAVDEELARLPERLRVVLVLCCLDGLSHEQAAGRLGCSPGSIRGRLARARRRLRARLTGRGISLPSALALLAASDSTAFVPPALFGTTHRAVVTGVAPPGVASLARAAAAGGSLSNAVAVALVAIACGVIAATGAGDPDRPAPPANAPAVAVPPQPVDRFGDPLPDGAVTRLGTSRLRHAELSAVAFTRGGNLVTFGRDYIARTWDKATGRQLTQRSFEKARFHRHKAGVLSADGRRLAVQFDNRVTVFDVESGGELASIGVPDAIEAVVRLSSDGNLVAVADGESNVRLCDVGRNITHDLARLKNSHSADLAFSRDGRRLALANFRYGAVVWDVSSRQELVRYRPHELTALSVDFDATGDVLAVLGTTNPPQQCHFVRVSTGRPPEGWSAPEVAGLFWARFAPDGSTVLLGGPKGLQWFDPKAGKLVRTAAGSAVVPPAFSGDGRLIASGTRNAVQVWSSDGRPAVPAEVGEGGMWEVHAVAVSPDGKWVLTNDTDGATRIWDFDGRLKGSIQSSERGGRYPAISPDGRYLFEPARDAVALVRRELPGGAESARYTPAPPVPDQTSVYAFALSADGRRLSLITMSPGTLPAPDAGTVATVTTWDTTTGGRLESREVEVNPYKSYYGAISPDLRWYYFGDRPVPLDGGATYGLELPDKSIPMQVAVSRDGRLVAQAMVEQLNDGRSYWTESRGVVVNETLTGKRVLTLPTEDCGRIAFTPDGRRLVVTDAHAITCWDLPAGKPAVRYRAPGTFVGYYGNSFASSLAVTPDGARAVTGHIDTTALVWDLRPCPRLVRVLSDGNLAAAWDDLAGQDAGKAFAALWSLADDPDRALPFLRARLHPITAPTDEDVGRLVAKLDARTFAEREAGTASLRQMGDAAAPRLGALLEAGLSREQSERVRKLLAEAEAPVVRPGDQLRQLRAISVLEDVGDEGAMGQLQELARGMTEARLTREAKAALDRLNRRPKPVQ